MKFITKTFAILSVSILTLIASEADAHVTYLLSKQEFAKKGGVDWQYLFSGITDSSTISVSFISIILIILGWFIYKKITPVREFFSRVSEKADSYSPFTPWMLRLSLGVALIGAGSQDFLISPILKGFPSMAEMQVLFGFLLMAGLFVVPVAFGAISIFIAGFMQGWIIIGSAEFAAIALALIVLDNERPGLDDMLGLPKISPLKKLKPLVPLILRIGVGVAMASMALYEKILNPLASEVIVNSYHLTSVINVPPAMWVLGAGVIELLLGIMHIIGWKTRPVVGLTFIVLSLSFFYFKEDVASHVTLFGALSALFILKGGPISVDAWLKNKNKKASI